MAIFLFWQIFKRLSLPNSTTFHRCLGLTLLGKPASPDIAVSLTVLLPIFPVGERDFREGDSLLSVKQPNDG